MSALSWKRGIGSLANLLPVASPRRVILLYHTLGRRAPAVSVARFREQLGWLMANAQLTTVDALIASARDFHRQNEPPELNARLKIALTFDDGYASLHDEVAPLLQSCGASATVYVNSGCIGERIRTASDPALGHYPDEAFLTWPEVQALANAGWTIGSHGVEHLDLTAVSTVQAAQQLAASKLAIANRTGRSCEHFAYTWGRFTPALQQQVKAAGYRSAASGLHGPLRTSSDPLALPRIDVRADYELKDFIAVVTGQWDFIGYKQRLWRAFA